MQWLVNYLCLVIGVLIGLFLSALLASNKDDRGDR